MDTANRTPLTSTTFADFHQGIHSTGRPMRWTARADLAHELHALAPHLTHEACRALMYAVSSGLPIQLQWDTRLNTGSIERTTTTVLVESLFQLPGDLRVRHCGFEHPVALHAVRDAEVPEGHREFLDS